MEDIECTSNLCNIILDEAIEVIKKSSNRDKKHDEIIKLLEQVGAEKRMLLHRYSEKKEMEFTIVNIKLQKVLRVGVSRIAPKAIKIEIFEIPYDF
ncbi:MAG: hypothetical protein ABW148_18720 [Sedimenticola sp.]